MCPQIPQIPQIRLKPQPNSKTIQLARESGRQRRAWGVSPRLCVIKSVEPAKWAIAGTRTIKFAKAAARFHGLRR
jgi:hypothetical protein